MSSHRRGPWSPPEDAYLVSLVHTQGPLNWVRIAQLIGTRSPKQCRERYHQNLKPSLNHEPISPEEGFQIERLVGEMGKRWAEIARRLHGRSDNAVKNWWNGSMNRRKRMNHRKKTSSQCLGINTFSSERNETLSFARPAASAERNSTYASSAASTFSSRRMHAPLPSPSVSETSRAESVDGGAPSLISDSGSAFSISPRVAASPTLELPPLSSFGRMDSRRASLPLLQLQSRSSSFEQQLLGGESHVHYQFSPRFPSESKLNSSSLPPPVPRRSEIIYSIPPPPPSPLSPTSLHYSNSRTHSSQALTAPSTPVHLPPLNIVMTARPEPSPERDARMHLSSLLG